MAQEALFYEFSLGRHVPANHLTRAIDRCVDLTSIQAYLRPFYSDMGRPSIDPELMIQMLIVGYCCGIRSERRLCEEVHFNLAYRWFCRLGLEGAVPDHSTFSKNRHGRFRDWRRCRNSHAASIPSHEPDYLSLRWVTWHPGSPPPSSPAPTDGYEDDLTGMASDPCASRSNPGRTGYARQ